MARLAQLLARALDPEQGDGRPANEPAVGDPLQGAMSAATFELLGKLAEEIARRRRDQPDAGRGPTPGRGAHACRTDADEWHAGRNGGEPAGMGLAVGSGGRSERGSGGTKAAEVL